MANPAAPAAATEQVVVTGARIARRDFGAEATSEKLGTAHGAREWSVSERVDFVRATPYPQMTLEIEYDTYANLRARGVIGGGPDEQHPPRAFPKQPRGGGYVPDPPDDR